MCYTFLKDFPAARRSLYFAEMGFEVGKHFESMPTKHMLRDAFQTPVRIGVAILTDLPAICRAFLGLGNNVPEIRYDEFKELERYITALGAGSGR